MLRLLPGSGGAGPADPVVVETVWRRSLETWWPRGGPEGGSSVRDLVLVVLQHVVRFAPVEIKHSADVFPCHRCVNVPDRGLHIIPLNPVYEH